MNLFRLSLNLLRRDWRAGEWRVLLIALVLAVGSIATVGLFADRVRLALQQEATSLLGADLRVSSSRPLPPAYRDAALQRGLRVVETASFPSMAAGKHGSVLAEILAVGEGYPLRGKIVINPNNPLESYTPILPPATPLKGGEEIVIPTSLPPLQGEGWGGDGSNSASKLSGNNEGSSIPARGTLWADARLMQRLGVQLGDEVGVGALRLRLVAEVVRDVDQSVGFASFAPRVLLNAADLPVSGLVQEGSRINYRLLVAGGAGQVADLRDWLQNSLGAGEKLEDVRDARPEIRSALDLAEHFLGLAALTAVILAGVALALAARQFISRHLDTCAMLRCLGAAQAQVLRIFLYQFLLLGAAAVLLGSLLGYAAQAALVESIASMRDAALPAPGWTPLWQAAASGMALLLGFTFLPLWQLKRVAPMRVIRRELGAPPASTGLLYASGGVVLCGLFLWQAGSLKLGLTVLAGLLTGLLLFGLLAWLIVRALPALPFKARLAFANLARHGRSNALQIVALSLGGMALLLLTLVRADLMESWRSRLPPDAPNRFIVNIQPDQRAAVVDFFAQQKLSLPDLFPMVRGRLIAINQRAVSGDDYPDPRARGLAERETNLSWSDSLPKNNELVQGEWWIRGQQAPSLDKGRAGEGLLSVEQGIAKTLGLKLGDSMRFDMGGQLIEAKITSLRKVDWGSMRVNFFVMFPIATLTDVPVSYISAFRAPEPRAQVPGQGRQPSFDNELVKAFPNITNVDMSSTLAQVQRVLDQVIRAVEFLFGFTLAAGLVVLFAAITATREERAKEFAIMRAVGAKATLLRQVQRAELIGVGLLAGFLASVVALAVGWGLARYVFDFAWTGSWSVPLLGSAAGALLALSAGWWGLRSVLNTPVVETLRRAQ